MGKHNGKSRRTGLSVGGALVNKARKDGRTGTPASYLYTTENGPKNNMQSIIENNDLEEMLSMAELAERDFAAERTQVVVVSTGAVEGRDAERAAEDRAEAESRHRHRLVIPRRPGWSLTTTPDELHAQERSSFLDWRRDLAALEMDERLILTPFEKNLEVWRQLWRVVERSDFVIQVVDARDPLTYRSEDLELYCREVHDAKRSMLLLNKADLLPEKLRSAWADYFDEQGVNYAFWSAKQAAEEEEAEEADGAGSHQHDHNNNSSSNREESVSDPRARLLSADELLDVLLEEARDAVAEAEACGLPRTSRGERFVVGLTGYPNVGKSSTINALFGSKKTAVAATPGKTKHFQTLNVSDVLCLCDCPGLVMPQFAHSKAEMVAAGVIPIDRLTDVRAPINTIALRVSREQFERVYGMKLPVPGADEDLDRAPTAGELLRALGISRGWVASSGLPDETKCGRMILKDYVDGKILACKPPPGASDEILRLVEEIAGRRSAAISSAALRLNNANNNESSGDSDESSEYEEEEAVEPPLADTVGALDAADLDLLDALDISEKKSKEKPVRAAHKFHKKAARVKSRSGGGIFESDADEQRSVGYGRRGGVVRSAG
jgi:large subunit GTPase 1